MRTEEGDGALKNTAAEKAEPATGTEPSASAPGSRTIVELTTEELDELVPALDASVREALRASPHDPELDDLKNVAAACRIERRRRHGRDRLNRAQQMLSHVGQQSAGGDRS